MKKRIITYDVKLVKEESKLYEMENVMVNSANAAGEMVELVCNLNDSTVEKFGIICLDTKNKVIGIHIINIGGLASCNVEIRGIFQRALLNNAMSIILFHNHPSGDPTPSPEDISITRKIAEAGDVMTIKVLDHIIVGDEGRYVSLAERGVI